jgi:hypothetical protein
MASMSISDFSFSRLLCTLLHPLPNHAKPAPIWGKICFTLKALMEAHSLLVLLSDMTYKCMVMLLYFYNLS